LKNQTSQGSDQQEAVQSELTQTVNHEHLFQEEIRKDIFCPCLFI